MRRIIKGVMGLMGLSGGNDRVVLRKEEIMTILPHRERMLLLDEVIITDQVISGQFAVTEEVCEGHQFNGQLVFRGVDTIEMAAQLLGVWAAQHPDYAGKLAYFRQQGGAKFSDTVLPFQILIIEAKMNNLRIEISGRPGRQITKIIGEGFSARVGKQPKARISSVELVVKD